MTSLSDQNASWTNLKPHGILPDFFELQDLNMGVALITGAANGIGLALSHVCLQKNNYVILVDKNLDKLKQESVTLEHQFPGQVLSIPCDITQPVQVAQLVEQVYQQTAVVDWIYNNAGIIGSLGPIWELPNEHIQHVLDVNVFGMINIIKGFMPHLLEQEQPSHIINMASMYALISGSQLAPYSMSKHAVLSLSESLYFDLKQRNKTIDVSVVFPSFTDTALLSSPSTQTHNPLQDTLHHLLSHSRPALEVAQHIVKEVEQKQFYILPDKEVKGYSEERTKAILLQDYPHLNNIEKMISALAKRKVRT